MDVHTPQKPATSRRQELEDRKASWRNDEAGTIDMKAVILVIVGATIGTWLVLMMGGMIEGQAASQRTSCSTWYTGDTPGIASCKERAEAKLLVWNIGSILLIIAGVGLGGLAAHRGHGSGGGTTLGVILTGAIGTWLVFMFGGMIESQSASNRTSCATWYAGVGNEAALAACKDRETNKMSIWNVVSFLLVLGACGMGAVGGHFAERAARNKVAAYRSRRSPGRGRYSY